MPQGQGRARRDPALTGHRQVMSDQTDLVDVVHTSSKWSASRLNECRRRMPARPEFWESAPRKLYALGCGARTCRARAIPEDGAADQRVLIPGCGSGYEVRAFAEAGLETLAIDFGARGGGTRATGPWDRSRTSSSRGSSNSISAGRSTSCTSAPSCARFRARCGHAMCNGCSSCSGRRQDRRVFLFEDGERGSPFGLKSGDSRRCSGSISTGLPMPR